MVSVFCVILSYYLHSIEKNILEVKVCYIVNMCIAFLICIGFPKILECQNNKKLTKYVRRAFCLVGEYSFEFYLTSELVSQKIKSYHLELLRAESLNSIIVFLICFAVSMISAWCLKKFVEYGIKTIGNKMGEK